MKLSVLAPFLLLFLPLHLPAEIRSSHVELPEKAFQGEPAEIRYVFEVSGAWTVLGPERTADGLRFLSRDHSEKRLSRSVMQVTVTCQVKSIAAGTVDLSPLKIVTDKGPQQIPGGSIQMEPHPDYGKAWGYSIGKLL